MYGYIIFVYFRLILEATDQACRKNPQYKYIVNELIFFNLNSFLKLKIY